MDRATDKEKIRPLVGQNLSHNEESGVSSGLGGSRRRLSRHFSCLLSSLFAALSSHFCLHSAFFSLIDSRFSLRSSLFCSLSGAPQMSPYRMSSRAEFLLLVFY